MEKTKKETGKKKPEKPLDLRPIHLEEFERIVKKVLSKPPPKKKKA